ncbi:hypothetical protein [Parasutterella excrementihominis]
MELSPLTIYLLSILDSTRDALAVVIGILGFLFATSFFLMLPGSPLEDDRPSLLRRLRILAITFLALLLLRTFIPTQKTMAAMIVVPAVINNVEVQSISKGAIQWADQYVQKKLKEEK